MAYKQFKLDGGTDVTVYKRRGARTMRLSVTAEGVARVTLPPWVAYIEGVKFAQNREDWIRKQIKPKTVLMPTQNIGHGYTLIFKADARSTSTRSRLTDSEVIITHPLSTPNDAPEVQAVAEKAAIKALKKQAELIIPPRVVQLAAKYDFEYASIRIKRLKSRWGSCDSHKNLTFNLFLMQLPSECIDYVILHELTHTKVMAHGPKFWQEMEKVLPEVQETRRLMRGFHPVLK